MAKSQLMRPLWIGMKLCNGDTIAAGMLEEIMFKANITWHKDSEDNHIIVYSLEEWSDITGLSINQVRKALKRLTDLNVIKVYTRKHPKKNVLRALHVWVSHDLWELWHCLTSAGYEYDGDILRTKQEHEYVNFRLSVVDCGQTKMSHVGHATMTTEGTPVCAEGADLSIYKKNCNDTVMAAAHKCATAAGVSQEETEEEIEKKESKDDEENKVDDYKIPDSLKEIKTLPNLLMALHHHYLKYFWDYMYEAGTDDLPAMQLWMDCIKPYGTEGINPREDTWLGLFVLMRKEFGIDTSLLLISKVMGNWKKFTEQVTAEYTVKIPTKPDFVFFYYFRHVVVNMEVVQPCDNASVAA